MTFPDSARTARLIIRTKSDTRPRVSGGTRRVENDRRCSHRRSAVSSSRPKTDFLVFLRRFEIVVGQNGGDIVGTRRKRDVTPTFWRRSTTRRRFYAAEPAFVFPPKRTNAAGKRQALTRRVSVCYETTFASRARATEWNATNAARLATVPHSRPTRRVAPVDVVSSSHVAPRPRRRRELSGRDFFFFFHSIVLMLY